MIHKIIMWISVVASIAGIIIVITNKFLGDKKLNLPSNILYIIIVFGVCLSVILALTDKNNSEMKKDGSVNAVKNSGNQIIVTNPENIGNINIGDTTGSAEKRFQNALQLVKTELLSNYSKMSVLLSGLKSSKPEKFWDIRKPNESEDTFQERAKNHYRAQQNQLFQMIQKFPICKDAYNSHKLNLSHNVEVAESVKNSYIWLSETYEDLSTYAEGLLHIISLYERDVYLHKHSLSLYSEKTLNSQALLLQSIDKFLIVFPDMNQSINDAIIDLKINIGQNGRVLLNKELQRLYQEKTKVLEDRLKKPQRKDAEIERIIKDPYLVMLRKTAGLSNTLSESEAWRLIHKEIDSTITQSPDLLTAAAMSFLESDGHASSYYMQKALDNKDGSYEMLLFMEKSLARLKNPDIFNGSIGLIILEIDKKSILKKKGLSVGDILFKMNGDILTEPSEISSMVAKTKKSSSIIFDIVDSNNQFRKVSISGGYSIGCKVSRLIILNSIQL